MACILCAWQLPLLAAAGPHAVCLSFRARSSIAPFPLALRCAPSAFKQWGPASYASVLFQLYSTLAACQIASALLRSRTQVLVGEAGGQERQLEVLGEMGNVTAKVVQPDIRTCGGAVIHIISDSISANYSREVGLGQEGGRMPRSFVTIDMHSLLKTVGGRALLLWVRVAYMFFTASLLLAVPLCQQSHSQPAARILPSCLGARVTISPNRV